MGDAAVTAGLRSQAPERTEGQGTSLQMRRAATAVHSARQRLAADGGRSEEPGSAGALAALDKALGILARAEYSASTTLVERIALR